MTPAVWELAAGGFRDTSRVAASDTRMFLDILMTNQPAVLAQLDNYLGQLTELRTLLACGDEAALAANWPLPGSCVCPMETQENLGIEAIREQYDKSTHFWRSVRSPVAVKFPEINQSVIVR